MVRASEDVERVIAEHGTGVQAGNRIKLRPTAADEVAWHTAAHPGSGPHSSAAKRDRVRSSSRWPEV